MLSATALTFDIDWAPDWTILECAAICERHGVPATFFVTHASAALDVLRRKSLFELGIHPNFLPGSTHGGSHEEVLDHCMALVPEARAMRTHALVQSSPILSLVVERHPRIEVDVSLFLPRHPDLQPVELPLKRGGGPFLRLPFYWEDDVEAARPCPDWAGEPPPSRGLRIFDFHPALICLNAASNAPYLDLKAALRGRNLQEATREEFALHAHAGQGAGSFLERLIQRVGPGEFRKISQIVEACKGSEVQGKA
jgi:hypothetical protein